MWYLLRRVTYIRMHLCLLVNGRSFSHWICPFVSCSPSLSQAPPFIPSPLPPLSLSCPSLHPFSCSPSLSLSLSFFTAWADFLLFLTWDLCWAPGAGDKAFCPNKSALSAVLGERSEFISFNVQQELLTAGSCGTTGGRPRIKPPPLMTRDS